jgi:hypothetical protein
MSRITFDLATDADDAALRAILRANPFPGAISVSFEREPCYFQAARLEGPFHQTLVARDPQTREITGMGTRSIRPVYVNGLVQSVGYLSQLRFTPAFKQGFYVARGLAHGMRFLQELHADGRAPFYLSSIIADNVPARRLLGSGLAAIPEFREYARMFTYAAGARRPKREIALPRGLVLKRGTPALVPQIVDCLQRNGARRQFAPYWDCTTLCQPEGTPDLSPHDFFLALDGPRVAGCLAGWSQMRLKQSVVRGYAGVFKYAPVLNVALRLAGLPELPPAGQTIRYRFASHIAIDDDDPALFAPLLRALYNDIAARGDQSLMIGFSEHDPLRAVFTHTYPHITYPSQIYLVAWEDGQPALARIDGRVPGLDISVL